MLCLIIVRRHKKATAENHRLFSESNCATKAFTKLVPAKRAKNGYFAYISGKIARDNKEAMHAS